MQEDTGRKVERNEVHSVKHGYGSTHSGVVAHMYDCSAEVAEADGTCSFSSTAYLACASPVDAWSQKNKWEMTG